MEPKISVVINTLNEEMNLPYALRSVRSWVDEIIVVDMHSEDRTVQIAKDFGAKVFFHERMGFADPARKFAIAQAAGTWILVLDADEMIPQPLSRKLVEVVQADSADAVALPMLHFILGKPLMHSGCGPRQWRYLRFFRRGSVYTTATIHDYLHAAAGARVTRLPYQPGLAIVHFAYADVCQILERFNRYTTIQAQQAFEKGQRASLLRALRHSAATFVRCFVLGRGYMDGWRGFYFSSFMFFYRLASYAKLQEQQSVGRRETVVANYRLEAERLLEEYLR